MANYSSRVLASADDGYWAGGWSYNSSSVGIGKNGLGQDVYSAFRFNSVNVPQGTTITSATLTITDEQNSSSSISTRFYGLDEDDTANFTSDPTGRSKTTAYTNYSQSNQTTNTTHDISVTSIVQEIVNRAGWSSGNDLGFITVDQGSSNDNILRYFSYDGSTTKCALLSITWSGASPSASISLSPSSSQSPSSSVSPSSSFSASPSPPPDQYIGIKVSKPGIDVKTSESPNDFYLNSMFPLLKVHAFGTFSFSVGAESTTIYHNLGYKPFVFVFSKLVDRLNSVTTEYYQHDWFIEGASEEWVGRTKIYDDRIIIEVRQTTSTSGTVNGFYYIFKDEV